MIRRIKGNVSEFIKSHVFCCLTEMVEDLIHVRRIDPYKNYEQTAQYAGRNITCAEFERLLKNFESALLKAETVEEMKLIQSEIDELENLKWSYPQIQGYWGVSDFMAEKLEEKGEIIMKEYSVKIWGRQVSGQDIGEDDVVNKVYEEREGN